MLTNGRAVMRRRTKIRDVTTEKYKAQLSMLLAEHLWRMYPGYEWRVSVDGGVVYIKNASLSGVYGYKLFLADVCATPDLHIVTMAGGEILERFLMRRGVIDRDALASKKRDFAGRLQFDA